MQQSAGIEIAGRQLVEAVGQFEAVGADVLDRRGAQRSGDQRQVFEPRPALRQRPSDGLVPPLATTEAQVARVSVLTNQLAPRNGHVHHQPIEFAGKNKVAAPTEDETPTTGGQAGKLGELGAGFDTGVVRRAARQGKGVARREVDAGLNERG